MVGPIISTSIITTILFGFVSSFLSRRTCCSDLVLHHRYKYSQVVIGTTTNPWMPPRRRSMKAFISSHEEDADVQLFHEWLQHTDMSFHSLDETTASKIRSSLLTWYRQHRRKLPWRGDPPPYDGSTAGINTVPNAGVGSSSSGSSGKGKTRKSKDASLTKITNFFAPNKTTSTDSITPPVTTSTCESFIATSATTTTTTTNNTAAIPVSAYGVWVSEIMLQQTRVEAVIPYWIRWMTSFPTVHDLAAATEEQVNAHWAGLGFYRRARLLHQGAKLVVDNYHGELPRTVEGLLQITGIGPYTASAIASIAFGVRVPVVDGNVCRVLSRLTGIANHIKAPALKDKFGWELAKQLVVVGDEGSDGTAGEINQALMELGATYCAPSGTGIDPRDPLQEFYWSTRIAKAYHTLLQDTTTNPFEQFSIPDSCRCGVCDSQGIQTVLRELEQRIDKNMSVDDARKQGHAIFPLDPPKTKKREEDLAVLVLANHHGGDVWWLFIRRPPEGLLAGQWEFPSVCMETRQEGEDNSSNHDVTQRRKRLTHYLSSIVANGNQSWWSNKIKLKTVNDEPIDHVFSHIRHIMWLESAILDVDLKVTNWTTTDGREVRWMREKDWKKVGITSGVKKILKVVQSQHGDSASTTVSARKRKR